LRPGAFILALTAGEEGGGGYCDDLADSESPSDRGRALIRASLIKNGKPSCARSRPAKSSTILRSGDQAKVVTARPIRTTRSLGSPTQWRVARSVSVATETRAYFEARPFERSDATDI
jgi:hypothetical protein